MDSIGIIPTGDINYNINYTSFCETDVNACVTVQ
jgi:hypothetical protein